MRNFSHILSTPLTSGVWFDLNFESDVASLKWKPTVLRYSVAYHGLAVSDWTRNL